MYIALASSLAIFAFLLWFVHRDPNRKINRFNGYLCPANGTVSDIYTVTSKKEFIKKHGAGINAFLDDFPQAKKIVVIMMKPWHVHTQRAPSDGVISKVVYKKGKKLNAVNENYRKATAENEHCGFTISGKKPCKVYLIAGFAARRIRPIAIKGQKIKQGERIGKITFGSQVALILPKTKLLVKVGDSVTDGITRVAQ